MWLDLTTSHRQTWLFNCTSTYHSTDLLTAHGVAHLVVHGTTGSTSYETIPPFVRLESSGGVLSTVDMVVQRRNGPRRLRDHDDDDDDVCVLQMLCGACKDEEFSMDELLVNAARHSPSAKLAPHLCAVVYVADDVHSFILFCSSNHSQ